MKVCYQYVRNRIDAHPRLKNPSDRAITTIKQDNILGSCPGCDHTNARESSLWTRIRRSSSQESHVHGIFTGYPSETLLLFLNLSIAFDFDRFKSIGLSPGSY